MSFAILFDIDGVIYRENIAIPGAVEALKIVLDQNIPHCFITNGGGTPERIKMDIINSFCPDIKVITEQIITSHTPFNDYYHLYEDKTVLMVGRDENYTKEIAETYNVKNYIDLKDFALNNPNLIPWRKLSQNGVKENPAIGAIFIVHEPYDGWEDAIQIILDILTSKEGIIGQNTFDYTEDQHVPIFFANPDFEYSSHYGIPRLTQGAFILCIKTLYQTKTGRELQYKVFGKPYPEIYHYSTKYLNQICNEKKH